MKRAALLALAAVLVVLSAAPEGALAQGDPVPSCAAKLIDCAGDLNATKPSDKCCASIKDAVETQLSCLCSLLGNQELLKTFNVNVTKALELPKKCGINSDTSLCSKVASPPGSSVGSSPVTPGTNATAGTPTKDAAHGITCMGLSGLASLLLFWWSIVG